MNFIKCLKRHIPVMYCRIYFLRGPSSFRLHLRGQKIKIIKKFICWQKLKYLDKSRKIYKKYETWIFGFMWTAPEKKKSCILNNVKKLISSEFLFPMTSARGKILWITRKHSCTLMLTNQQQTSLKSWNTSWNSLPLTFSQTALLFNNRVQKFSNISIVDDVFSLTDKILDRGCLHNSTWYKKFRKRESRRLMELSARCKQKQKTRNNSSIDGARGLEKLLSFSYKSIILLWLSLSLAYINKWSRRKIAES